MKKILSTIFILCSCFIYNNCIAADNTPKLTFEQLTAKYPSMEQYTDIARKDIKDNWYPPVNSFENTATIVLTINKEGKLIDCEMNIPSPNEEFNESLINAAKKTNYAPLPSEVKEDVVNIDMEFSMQRRKIFKRN